MKLILSFAIGATLGALLAYPQSPRLPSVPYALTIDHVTKADVIQCRRDPNCNDINSMDDSAAHAVALADCYDEQGFTPTDMCEQLLTGKEF